MILLNDEVILKMKKIILVLLSIVLVSTMLIACQTTIPEDKVCAEDVDCVAATCCHASDVVNRYNAPDCAGVLCTANCEPDTLDCGQMVASCIEGECELVEVQ